MRISMPLGAARIALGQGQNLLVPRGIRQGQRAQPAGPPEGIREGDRRIPPGKAALTVPEAKDLLASLDLVVRPIEKEERALAEHECLRELQAGPFPQVVRLKAKVAAFLETAAPGDLFPVSAGELEVLEKAVACAESLGRGRAVKVAVAAGGGAAVLALLLLA